MKAVALIAGACALACGIPARGDEADQFRAVLSGAVVQQHALDAAKKSTVLIQNPCPEAQFSFSPPARVLKPLTFDGAELTGGAWQLAVEERGCGADRVLNVLQFVQPPKSLISTPLLPGTTHADPTLQRDGVHYAVLAIGGPEKNCSIGYVADTQFQAGESAPVSGGKFPPWTETWTLVTCTKEFRIGMRFVPDATGTAITAHLDAATPVKPAK